MQSNLIPGKILVTSNRNIVELKAFVFAFNEHLADCISMQHEHRQGSSCGCPASVNGDHLDGDPICILRCLN